MLLIMYEALGSMREWSRDREQDLHPDCLHLPHALFLPSSKPGQVTSLLDGHGDAQRTLWMVTAMYPVFSNPWLS